MGQKRTLRYDEGGFKGIMLNFAVSKIMVNKINGDYIIDLTLFSGQLEIIVSLTKEDVENIQKSIKEVIK